MLENTLKIYGCEPDFEKLIDLEFEKLKDLELMTLEEYEGYCQEERGKSVDFFNNLSYNDGYKVLYELFNQNLHHLYKNGGLEFLYLSTNIPPNRTDLILFNYYFTSIVKLCVWNKLNGYWERKVVDYKEG